MIRKNQIEYTRINIQDLINMEALFIYLKGKHISIGKQISDVQMLKSSKLEFIKLLVVLKSNMRIETKYA